MSEFVDSSKWKTWRTLPWAVVSWWWSLGGGLKKEEEEEKKNRDRKAVAGHGGWFVLRWREKPFLFKDSDREIMEGGWSFEFEGKTHMKCYNLIEGGKFHYLSSNQWRRCKWNRQNWEQLQRSWVHRDITQHCKIIGENRETWSRQDPNLRSFYTHFGFIWGSHIIYIYYFPSFFVFFMYLNYYILFLN